MDYETAFKKNGVDDRLSSSLQNIPVTTIFFSFPGIGPLTDTHTQTSQTASQVDFWL